MGSAEGGGTDLGEDQAGNLGYAMFEMSVRHPGEINQ